MCVCLCCTPEVDTGAHVLHLHCCFTYMMGICINVTKTTRTWRFIFKKKNTLYESASESFLKNHMAYHVKNILINEKKKGKRCINENCRVCAYVCLFMCMFLLHFASSFIVVCFTSTLHTLWSFTLFYFFFFYWYMSEQNRIERNETSSTNKYYHVFFLFNLQNFFLNIISVTDVDKKPI